MQLEGMDASFRQADVVLHFVLGLLSWSGPLGRAVAEPEPAASETASAELSGLDPASLHLLLGLISFDQTLRAALERAAAAVVTGPECAAGVECFELRLGR
ncbi:MAG: hypothetical protein ABI895_19260 [Deltaproteobacteria bacterium]